MNASLVLTYNHQYNFKNFQINLFQPINFKRITKAVRCQQYIGFIIAVLKLDMNKILVLNEMSVSTSSYNTCTNESKDRIPNEPPASKNVVKGLSSNFHLKVKI